MDKSGATTYYIVFELGPLPSTGITRLRQYYGPLRHPRPPGLAVTSHLLGISFFPTTKDFPCCARSSSFIHAVANTPVQPLKILFALNL